MNVSFWVGLVGAVFLSFWGVTISGASHAVSNLHGMGIVLGGTFVAALMSSPMATLTSAFSRFLSLLAPGRLPTAEECVAEVAELGRKSQAGGGLLSIRDDAREVAGGFLHRAVMVAIATGESKETRRIMEKEIKQVRISCQEDANVFRTLGTLAPMFGILGTLLGMIKVLETVSDPSKVGASMALALSSAFLGIALSNFFFIPVAGQIRGQAMRETLVLEILLEGILDIAAGQPAYLIELHLAAYSKERRRELEEAEGAPARVAPGAVP